MAEAPKHCVRCWSPLTREMVGGICAACLLEEVLPVAEGRPGPMTDPTLGSEPAVRQHFGPYELLEEIGRGGMGVIFKARQPGLDRVVALKMLLAGEFADAKTRERLLREARFAARLSHPGIVTIHDVGEVQGRPYFAMEYVSGSNLAQRCRDGLLPVNTAVRYVEQLADAVHYAHQHGVIHRDLKPANVLLTAKDDAKLTDFGLTKSLVEPTRTVESAGSPNYMAPEQADSQLGATGTATDVFGLGAILYHLLTGRPPAVGESLSETLRAVTLCEPVPPRQLRPALPKDLETITLKCLEREPSRRYASAREVAEELARWRNHEPIHARSVTRLGILLRWARRNPQVAALGAGLVATGILGVEGVLWQWRRAETARQHADRLEAESPWRRIPASADLHLAELALADVNRDGWMDVIGVPEEDGVVAVFLGRPAGQFELAKTSPIRFSESPEGKDSDAAVAVADFDGDGASDLAVANGASASISMLRGDGAGGFTKAGPPILVGRGCRRILTEDWDGDGRLDLVVSNFDDASLSVLLGWGTLQFQRAPESPIATGEGPWGMARADFNRDGQMDLAVANTFAGTVSVYLNVGAGRFVAGPGSPFQVGVPSSEATSARPFDVTSADINEDGYFDLISADTSSHTITLLLGDGQGGFTKPNPSQHLDGAYPRRVHAADLDGDGHLDLITANEFGNLSLLKGNGAGRFFPVSGSPLFQPEAVVSCAIADLDRDGLPDLAVCGSRFGITVTRNSVLHRHTQWSQPASGSK